VAPSGTADSGKGSSEGCRRTPKRSVGAGLPAHYTSLACNPAPWLTYKRRQAGAYRAWLITAAAADDCEPAATSIEKIFIRACPAAARETDRWKCY